MGSSTKFLVRVRASFEKQISQVIYQKTTTTKKQEKSKLWLIFSKATGIIILWTKFFWIEYQSRLWSSVFLLASLCLGRRALPIHPASVPLAHRQLQGLSWAELTALSNWVSRYTELLSTYRQTKTKGGRTRLLPVVRSADASSHILVPNRPL